MIMQTLAVSMQGRKKDLGADESGKVCTFDWKSTAKLLPE
jgi:hypothetical protein